VFSAVQTHANNTRDIAGNLHRVLHDVPWESDAHDPALATNRAALTHIGTGGQQVSARRQATEATERPPAKQPAGNLQPLND
jgi:hypothetical protein